MVPRSADRNGYSHTLSRHGEEMDNQGAARNKRATFAAQRKMAKILKSQHSPTALRRSRVPSPGESEPEEEDQGEADDEDHAQPDDSEDEEVEPRMFAPSGAAVLHIKASGHQAGHQVPKSRALSPALRRRTSPTIQRRRTRRGSQLAAQSSPSPISPKRKSSLPDDAASSSDDDDIYELVDLMSEDDEEDDDFNVEEVEEQMLLEEMAANGELGSLHFGDGDSMFPQEDGTSTFGHGSLYSDRYGIPEEGFDMSVLTSRRTSVNGDELNSQLRGSNLVTPFESDMDMEADLAALTQSALTSPLATTFPSAPEQSGLMDASNFHSQTGLCTPSSLKQPVDWTTCDPDETDQDEPKPENISVNVAALRKKHKPQAVAAVTSGGIRKNKKFKTPKAGSFKISKKDICMSHDRAGKLVVSGNKKARQSGYNTPKGIVPVDPFKLTPSEGGFSNTIRTLQFPRVDSDAALASVEQATAMLFQSTTGLAGPLLAERSTEVFQSSLEAIDPKSNPFIDANHAAEEDLSRYVDFLGKEGE